MKAVKVYSLFGDGYHEDYSEREHEFTYKGYKYLPIDVLMKTDYCIRCSWIEELDIE